ncbi:MAG: HNH endonuclease [Eubacterium sp.]|nr:HNH endonuclease [Eubacterium sp.]
MVNYLEVCNIINDSVVYNIRPHMYYISNYGRVYSYNIHDFLRPSLDHNGYVVYNLKLASGKNRMCKAHRLVAKSFFPVPDMDNLQVNHKDGIKTNNFIHNLEWMTSKENIHHAIETGLRNTFGENIHTAVLTADQVLMISELIIKNTPLNEIIYMTGLPNSNQSHRLIWRILNKETWATITKDYDFSKYNPNTSEWHQVFTYDQLHSICQFLEINGVQSDTQSIMDYIGLGEVFRNLSYRDKKKYYGAISKLKCKSRFKDICEKYNY